MNSIRMSDFLAFKGSSSERNTALPYGKQWIHKEDIQAVADIYGEIIWQRNPL